jgi:hypothetical protein
MQYGENDAESQAIIAAIATTRKISKRFLSLNLLSEPSFKGIPLATHFKTIRSPDIQIVHSSPTPYLSCKKRADLD